MAARGVPAGTASRWYRDRARTGHPEKAGRIGRTDYWFDDEWTAWHRQHVSGRLHALTRPDRDGDPEELVDAAGAARILGYSGRTVIHANRRLGYFPEPDGWGTSRNGRRAPLWKRSTVWAVADGRVGVGGSREPRVPHGPSKPHPYAGDERLDVVVGQLRAGQEPSSAGLAAAWGTSQRTAERIIRAAREFLRSSGGGSSH